VVDDDDETLTQLRKKYGPVVANAVGAAALEIETWNPSGRYIVQMPWDFKANKKASLGLVFEHLVKTMKKVEKDLKDSQLEVKEKNKLLLALRKGQSSVTPAPSRKRGRA